MPQPITDQHVSAARVSSRSSSHSQADAGPRAAVACSARYAVYPRRRILTAPLTLTPTGVFLFFFKPLESFMEVPRHSRARAS
jgi:hypothetical protein